MNTQIEITPWTCEPLDNCTIEYYLSRKLFLSDESNREEPLTLMSVPFLPSENIKGLDELLITQFNEDTDLDNGHQVKAGVNYISVDIEHAKHFMYAIHGRVKNYETYVVGNLD